MQTLVRILLVALAVLLIPVLLIGVPTRAAAAGFEVIVRIVALAAGAVALAAIALAVHATIRVRRLEADLTRYARSVETLLRRAVQPARDPATPQARLDPATPQTRRVPRRAQSKGAAGVSFQTIIDIEADATAGRLVYAILPDVDGSDRHVAFPPGVHGEGFALAALHAAQDLPDQPGEAIIVPLADAVLDSEEAVERLEAAFPDRSTPPILSLRAGHTPATSEARRAADRLVRAGYRFAIDFADALDLGGPALDTTGVTVVRARAPALIAALGADRTIQAAIAELPATVRLVAVDVVAETDALALAGRGVRYMAGPLFGDPKPFERPDRSAADLEDG